MRAARLDWVTSVVRDTVRPESMVGHEVTHYSIPAYDETGGPVLERGDDIGSAKMRVRGGEVLISKLNPRKARVQIVADVPDDRLAVCSGEFIVLRPSGIDARYLKYVLLSDRFRQQLESRVQSVTRSQQRVDLEDIAHAWIDVPEDDGQEYRIADLLDAETARIDALASAARRLCHLVEERVSSCREDILGSCVSAVSTSLKHMATVQAGLTLNAARSSAVATARPYLRVANVQPGSLSLDTVKTINATEGQIRRHSLKSGDVLMTEGGDRDKLGRGVVWRDEVVGALHQNHVFAVRPHPQKLLPEYLEMVLAGSSARQYFESTASQTTNLASTNTSIVGKLSLARPTLEEQHRVVAEFAEIQARHRRIVTAINRQIALLGERRQALITAVVTGQLQVPDAGMSNAAA